MIEYNALNYNGIKSSSFPFKVYIEQNDGINIPQRKSKLITTDQMTGALIKSSDDYATVEKHYKFYVHNVTLEELAPLFRWLNSRKDENERNELNPYSPVPDYLIAYDNPNRVYTVLKVAVSHAVLDEFGGYEFEVTFTCQPFSYPISSNSDVIEYPSVRVINNQTSVPMYPSITVNTSNSEQAMITIGSQTIRVKAPNNQLMIECFPGRQNVSDTNGLLNECMIGEFFKVPPGTHGISVSENVTSLTINCRWGELI